MASPKLRFQTASNILQDVRCSRDAVSESLHGKDRVRGLRHTPYLRYVWFAMGGMGERPSEKCFHVFRRPL
ncbi:hypothetical protein [Neisseria bacilliformis]|uniref:Uncharacterized protein n=1 Tax=Neisseria bacilliformis ATCC BAA-1200 TaxID=888742 RepID=F2B9F9_9NEIS|nr:hypothetical protein [Neisseria bacilliformis]EGF11963.1 hypothetical protein HMPREF9123_0405 [Neisseria bacilliformis ATCC BAA-1200]QMT47678.1 hypothetical protein H3L91_00525 [Neisseria bacilliformis]